MKRHLHLNLGSRISSIEKVINLRQATAWTAIDRL